MLINTLVFEDGPGEMRAAALAGGRVFAIHHHRDATPSRVGAVYRGRVRRIVPALNVAFIDLGVPPDGFLRANGVRWPNSGPRRLNRVLQEGAALTVQVTRDALADKGPVVSTLVRLPGRFMDYCPAEPGVRCDAAIGESTQRHLMDTIADDEGVCLRREPRTDHADALRADLCELRARWASLKTADGAAAAAGLLGSTPTPLEQVMTTYHDAPLRSVQTCSMRLHKEARQWCVRLRPELGERVEMAPATDLGVDIDAEVDLALADRLSLPDGIALLFDEGEVLTAIDVNSGGDGVTPGRASLDINLAALPEIARQLRLRRIGGAIVIDLLKMRDGGERSRVVAAFRELAAADPAGCHVLGVSALGLLELTRRRLGPSLAEELGERPAPRLRADAAAYRVLRRLRAEARAEPGARLAVEAAPRVAALLETDLQAVLWRAAAGGTEIRVRPGWPTDRFDVRRIG